MGTKAHPNRMSDDQKIRLAAWLQKRTVQITERIHEDRLNKKASTAMVAKMASDDLKATVTTANILRIAGAIGFTWPTPAPALPADQTLELHRRALAALVAGDRPADDVLEYLGIEPAEYDRPLLRAGNGNNGRIPQHDRMPSA